MGTTSLPLILASVREPSLLVLLAVALLASLVVQRDLWKRWGLPALGSLVLGDLVLLVPSLLGGSAPSLAAIAELIASELALVWAALVAWSSRKRMDVGDAWSSPQSCSRCPRGL